MHHSGDRDTREVWLITGAGRGMGVDIAKAVSRELDVTNPPTRNPPSRHLWTSLAVSMCWSTMPHTFMGSYPKSAISVRRAEVAERSSDRSPQ